MFIFNNSFSIYLEYGVVGQGRHASARMRVVYYAEPKDSKQSPKSVADEESQEARWVTVAELDNYRLRGSEPYEWFQYLDRGGAIYPMSLFTSENTPVAIPGKTKPAEKTTKERRLFFLVINNIEIE